MNGEHNVPGENTLEPRLARELSALSERGLEPGRDLWPELRPQLEPARRVPWWPRLVLAASLLVVVAGAFWIAARVTGSQPVELLGRARSASDLPASGTAELRAVFTRYLEQRQELLQLVSQALDNYPLELRRDVRRNVAVIEQAMREIEGSLARLEEAPVEELQLAALYDQELRLLRDLNARLRGQVAASE